VKVKCTVQEQAGGNDTVPSLCGVAEV